MISSGTNLVMKGDRIFKGNTTHNGILQKIHENAFTIGYSGLYKADGTSGAKVVFGDGVFYDLSRNDNRVFAGAPTISGAVPMFAGIVARETAIASSYPAVNDRVASYQSGMLVKEGFLNYKKGIVYLGSGMKYEDVVLRDYVRDNFVMICRKSDGKVYFSSASTVYETSGDIVCGRVVAVNPDDSSITVKVSPSMLTDTADVAGSTPTITNGTLTASSYPFLVAISIPATVKIKYKKTADTDFTDIDDVFTPTYNATTGKYEFNYEITGLTASTAYTVSVVAITACGGKTATGTGTTTAS